MLETRCKYYKNEAMFHGFIPHIMGTRFDILLIHSDIDRLNTLWQISPMSWSDWIKY